MLCATFTISCRFGKGRDDVDVMLTHHRYSHIPGYKQFPIPKNEARQNVPILKRVPHLEAENIIEGIPGDWPESDYRCNCTVQVW